MQNISRRGRSKISKPGICFHLWREPPAAPAAGSGSLRSPKVRSDVGYRGPREVLTSADGLTREEAGGGEVCQEGRRVPHHRTVGLAIPSTDELRLQPRRSPSPIWDVDVPGPGACPRAPTGTPQGMEWDDVVS